MAMQEVSRQPRPALTHEHCDCVAQLEESNERLRNGLAGQEELLTTACDKAESLHRANERLRAALESERKAEIWVTDAWLPNSPFLAWCLEQQQRGRIVVALISPQEAHDTPRYAGYYCEEAPASA